MEDELSVFLSIYTEFITLGRLEIKPMQGSLEGKLREKEQ